MTASIGIVLTTGTDCDADGLLRDADVAMYRAKERGPGNWEIFDEALRDRALERVATERALRRALEEGELRLYYQPIVSLDGGAVTGGRSARALAAPRPRPRAAGRLHPGRRGERPDPADRRMDAAARRAGRRATGAHASATTRRCP